MLELKQDRDRRGSLLEHYRTQYGKTLQQSRAEMAVSQGAKLQRLDALMRNVVENSFDGILTIRGDGQIEMANDAALKTFGYARNHLVESHISRLLPEMTRNPCEARSLFELGYGHREALGLRSDGSTFPIEMAISDARLDEERLFIAIVRDITERKVQQEQLEHQALHDALTGLPNRTLLIDRLNHALDFAKRERKPLGLLLLDLDRFKEVNDTLGHAVGDRLLRDVAQRLEEPIRRTDTIARLGGDEFAVLLPAVTDLERAFRVSQRIVDALQQPFWVESLSLEVGVSIGVSLYPDHADDESKLLQCADVAMYMAKENQTHIEIYSQDKDHNTIRHLTLTGELRKAIEDNQLSFEYQPTMNLQRDEISHVEALARWKHPTHGNIPPDEFILQAERTGLIQSFTVWEFDTALGQLARWKELGVDIGVALNLSAGTLHRPTLPDLLQDLLDKWAVDATRLTLELTESAIMIDPDSAAEILKRLDAIGVRLSIDDFGTGYSSLACLKGLPVDELKIDKSFVMHMTQNESDAVIVRSTIDLAHNLGLSVVAEGIESEEHLALLRGLGCDVGQGFFIGRPLPAAEITHWLRARRADQSRESGTAAAEQPAQPHAG